MQVKFRNATEEDADRIADVYLTSRKQFLSYARIAHSEKEVRLWVRQTLIPSGGVTVADKAGAIIGFLAVSQGPKYGWIDHLYLDSCFLGSGLGSSLVDLAKTQVHPPIRLYSFQQNDGARRFYRRQGFREIELTDGSGNEEKTPDVLLEWP